MTSKEKLVIIVLLIVLIIVILTVTIIGKTKNKGNETNNRLVAENVNENVMKLDNGTQLNTSKELKSAKTYKTVEIGNIQVSSIDGNSIILADVRNTGSTTFAREIVKMILIGENGQEIATIQAVIPELKTNETNQLNAMITDNIANIKDFRIEQK